MKNFIIGVLLATLVFQNIELIKQGFKEAPCVFDTKRSCK